MKRTIRESANNKKAFRALLARHIGYQQLNLRIKEGIKVNHKYLNP